MKKCSNRYVVTNFGEPPAPRLQYRDVKLSFDAPFQLRRILELQKALALAPSCGDCAFTTTDPQMSLGCLKITAARSYLAEVSCIPSSEIQDLAKACDCAISSGVDINQTVATLQTIIDAVSAFADNHTSPGATAFRQSPIDTSIFDGQWSQKMVAESFNTLFPDGRPPGIKDGMVAYKIISDTGVSPGTVNRAKKRLPGRTWPIARSRS